MKDSEFDQELKKAIVAEHRKEQKESLRSIEAYMHYTRSKKRFDWRIAASILLCIAVGGYFFIFDQAPSNQELYEQYYSPYENVVAPIVRNRVDLTQKAQAFALYEEGKYEKAINALANVSPSDSLPVQTLHFYQANAYLAIQKLEEAKELFQNIVDGEHLQWKRESLWYLTLVSLQMNDTQTAKAYLRKLQKEENQAFKNQEIQELLDTLD